MPWAGPGPAPVTRFAFHQNNRVGLLQTAHERNDALSPMGTTKTGDLWHVRTARTSRHALKSPGP